MDTCLKPFTQGYRNEGLKNYNCQYKFDPLIDYSPERHFHDYYEFYLHISGGQYMSVETAFIPYSPVP